MSTAISDGLILSHFSLGRFIPFEERVVAAAQAGYVGIGLWLGDYVAMRAAGRSDSDLRAVLDDYGLRVMEFEALRGWASDGEERAASRKREETIYRMADSLGSGGSFQILGSYPGTIDRAAEALAAVCDRAAEHGLCGAIEFLPEMTNIPDAHAAWELARLADRPNIGLCLDSWHHFRGANDLALLAAVPPERFFTVQINDGPARRVHADYYRDCTETRLPPGEGAFALAGFVRTLDGLGVSVPYSVEVLSTDLQARESSSELARHLATSTRTLLTDVRAGSTG